MLGMPAFPSIRPSRVRTRVVLADEAGFSRNAIASLLAETPGVDLVEVTTDGAHDDRGCARMSS
jgi:hypothetical protein